MLVLLVGPKGSGKSHVGRLLERHLGVHFFHVEAHWMQYYADCRAAGHEASIAGGIARVHPRIREALDRYEHVCVETTGASPEILAELQALRSRTETLVARLTAPVEVCVTRIRQRSRQHQIPVDESTIRQVHELSDALVLAADVVLDNESLSESAIVESFRPSIAGVVASQKKRCPRP